MVTLRARLLLVLVTFLISFFLAVFVIAPWLAVSQPKPEPTIERVYIPTADVLNDGTTCVYLWGETIYTSPTPAGSRCPTAEEARAIWVASLVAPKALVSRPTP